MLFRNTLGTILAALLMSGCANFQTRAELKADVMTLHDRVASLKTDVHDTCMMALELVSGGMLVYLGDDLWLDITTMDVIKDEEFPQVCLDTLDQFRELVDARAELRAALEPKAEADAPPVQVK